MKLSEGQVLSELGGTRLIFVLGVFLGGLHVCFFHCLFAYSNFLVSVGVAENYFRIVYASAKFFAS